MIDLDTGRILWVAKGRGKDALVKFWRRLRLAKARVEAVACDMSAAYWSAILENLPEAAIVFDHFHIIKLANEKIDDLRRTLQREAEVLGYQTLKPKNVNGKAVPQVGSADFRGGFWSLGSGFSRRGTGRLGVGVRPAIFRPASGGR